MNVAVGLMDGLGLDGDWCIRVIPRHLEGGYTPSEGTPQVLTSGGATESFRTHPTGMLSCYCLFF